MTPSAYHPKDLIFKMLDVREWKENGSCRYQNSPYETFLS